VSDIERDEAVKVEFDTQMVAVMDLIATGSLSVFKTFLPPGSDGKRSPFEFLECDAVGGDVEQVAAADTTIAWTHGQLPFVDAAEPSATVSVGWPKNMPIQDLYPMEFSTYVYPTGTSVEVSCFTQKEVQIQLADCPANFINPQDPNHIEPCVQRCPVAAYTDEEYTTMWMASNIVGVLGLFLNIFMACTWYLGGKKAFRAVPHQLKV
jgi:hypothetical protein